MATRKSKAVGVVAVKTKPKPKPQATADAKKFAKEWPEKLMLILHVMHQVGIEVTPVIDEGCWFKIEDQNLSNSGFWTSTCYFNVDGESRLPIRTLDITPNHRSDLDMLYGSCTEYMEHQRQEQLKRERRDKVLRELSDEQLEALDLRRPYG